MMKDTIYKLPLNGMIDKDIIKWIDSMPRNKKAEVVRHAIRFYMTHLVEGEGMIVMPTVGNPQVIVPDDKPGKKLKVKLVKGLGGMI